MEEKDERKWKYNVRWNDEVKTVFPFSCLTIYWSFQCTFRCPFSRTYYVYCFESHRLLLRIWRHTGWRKFIMMIQWKTFCTDFIHPFLLVSTKGGTWFGKITMEFTTVFGGRGFVRMTFTNVFFMYLQPHMCCNMLKTQDVFH